MSKKHQFLSEESENRICAMQQYFDGVISYASGNFHNIDYFVLRKR